MATRHAVPPLSKNDSPIRRVAVALQGGGSHGAFTWGVLDRLLQEPGFEIVGASGTSAGAMNAGILADGLRCGGATEARGALEHYWEDVGRLPGYASFSPSAPFVAKHTWHLEHDPLFLWHEALTRMWSPYETNPLNYNPLRKLLARIDFEGLRHDPTAARVFICATNVRTGLRYVFENAELSADVLLASAALPQVSQAVEIDGEHYWDGGYTGNPALAPLYLNTDATDLIIVGINPIVRPELPRTARAITDRIGEISFNSSLVGEVAAIAFFEDMMKSRPADRNFRRLFVHGIGDAALASFGASSKMNNHPDFLRHLHQLGERAAERWLAENRDNVGNRSTVDLSGLVPTRHASLISPSINKQKHKVQT
jgi:NTE family protein